MCALGQAALADSVKGLKGGALATAVQRYAQHGDPFVRGLLVGVLTATCSPIYDMLERWMLEGRLEDPHGEFFIVKDPEGAPPAAPLPARGTSQPSEEDMSQIQYSINVIS